VMISMAVGHRRCSHCGKISESLEEECEVMDVVRPPRRVARISGWLGTEMGVCVEASLV
jgi:hypothetical protein